jgi:hypothetical protein
MADGQPQMIAVDVVDAMLKELQAQRDRALKDSVDKAAVIFSLGKELQLATAELRQEQEVIKPALLAEIADLKNRLPIVASEIAAAEITSSQEPLN